MELLKTILGEFQWVPPKWVARTGRPRLISITAGLAVLFAACYAGYHYYQSLPKPPHVEARVVAPGLTPIKDEKLEPQPLRINFSVQADPRAPVATVDSVARIDLVGKVIKDGIVLSPAVSGEWRWTSQTQLQFLPAEDWPAGQTYTVRYDPALFAPQLILADTRIKFTTPKFSANLDELVFYQDPVKRSLRKVVGTISFTHPVDVDSLKDHLNYAMRDPGETVDQAAKPVEYEIQFDKHRRKAFVHSTPIELPEQETYLTLLLAEGLAPEHGPSRMDNTFSKNVRIPDVGSYFRVENMQSLIVRNQEDEPEQTLTIAFTDRVNTEALANRLTVYLLPEDRIIARRIVRKDNWSSPREVTEETLARSTRLDISLNPAENDASDLHSLRVDVPENRYIYLRVEQGLESDGGFHMGVAYDRVLRTAIYPKEVKIARDGAVLPLTGSHRLTFLARGVTELKVEIGRLIDGQINHLVSQTQGDIGSPHFVNYKFGKENLVEQTTRIIQLNAMHPKIAVYANLDLSEYLPDGGFYFIRVQGWDSANKRPIGNADERFVLITDLGLLVKSNADFTQDVFVHSIDSGDPLPGATVELLGKNGVAVVSLVTDSQGHVKLPATNALKREKEATAFLVRFGEDSIFMPYARGERMLQYARYDVGGERIQPGKQVNRLTALVFSDRGLYRPGESVNLAAIVKRADWVSLGELPLRLKIQDPRGKNVMDKRLSLPGDGFLEQPYATEEVSATGNYVATLYLIEENDRHRSIGSTTFKVEEFLPDRLRIKSSIVGQKDRGWLKPGDLSCQVSLENLFGTPAESRRVTGKLELSPSAIYLSEYKGYVFDDPLREGGAAIKTVSQELAAVTTDAAGLAQLPLELSRYDKGIYRLNVFTEGFEEGGGRSVKALASVMLSPLDYLVGYKSDTDRKMIKKGGEHAVEFVAIDSDGTAIAVQDVTLEIIEERYVSTLVKRDNGTYAYQSVRKEIPVSRQAYNIATQGSRFELPTESPGSFHVKIIGANGLVLSKVPFTVAGARNLAGNLERNAELELKLYSNNFAPGEQIEMEITAPYAGVGLITIERDKVYTYKWFKTDTNTSVQTITVPEQLEGNAYVNVAFVRDLDSPEVFVSPLSYAAEAFSVNRDARTVNIELDVPEKVQPGDELSIAYTTSQDARIVIFAVDEGILQVANYKMPDPLEFFIKKMALQVSTYQMVDQILPEFDLIRHAAAPGGGKAADLLGKNLNPFRRKTEAPAVFWSGVVDAGPEQKTQHFTVPDYFNGSLRVMAVAVADSAVGSSQVSTLVRGPFVITPSVLTAAAPGDEFDVTVGLSNNLEGSGVNAAIVLSVESSEHLEVIGEQLKTLTIDEGREGRALFRVRARAQPGGAKMMFVARLGDVSARLGSTLSVRPSVPYVATVNAGTSRQDPLRLNYERTLHDEFAGQGAAASVSPLVLADGLLDYLDAFPHACAEQIVSKVFPQIGFLNTKDYGIDEKKIRTYFDMTVSKLRSRQDAEGGFRFWASSPEAAEFPSVYILHFFTDAREQGLPVPRDMLDSGLGYLQRLAARETSTLVSSRLRAYAIYVLTRNGKVTTNYLTNLHEYLDMKHAEDWRGDLVAAYMAASYEMLKKTGLGGKLVGAYELGAGDERASDFDTRLGRDAQYLYLLARHFPDQLNEVKGEAINNLVQPIMENRFNTLSSAYTILALGAYADVLADGPNPIKLQIKRRVVDGAEDQGGLLSGPAAMYARADVPNEISDLSITGADGADIFYSLSQKGFDKPAPTDALAQKLEIFREYLDAKGNPVSKAQVGTELTVRLRVRSLGRTHTNVAIVDLLPGGFEVLRESIRDDYNGWHADYRDVREDRVVIYGTFADRITEILYRVKLTTPGNFVVPSAHAGSMYDRSVQARTAPGRFTVERVR